MHNNGTSHGNQIINISIYLYTNPFLVHITDSLQTRIPVFHVHDSAVQHFRMFAQNSGSFSAGIVVKLKLK